MSGEVGVGCAAASAVGKLSRSVPGGLFFLRHHSFCAYLTSALSVTVCAAQVLAVKNTYITKKGGTGMFQSLLTDILNEELALPLNESEFALS